MKALTTLSGGLDSTYLVEKVLRETTDDVTAVNLSDATNAPMGARLHEIVRWLSANVRPFTFENVPCPAQRPGEWFMPTLLRYAAQRCEQEKFDRFYVGRTADNALKKTPALPKYQAWWSRHVKTATLELPLLDLGRAQIWARMSPALRALGLGCAAPSLDKSGAVVACGRCHKCKWDADIVKFLARGYTADQIADYHLRARAAGKYTHLHGEDRFRLPYTQDINAALND